MKRNNSFKRYGSESSLVDSLDLDADPKQVFANIHSYFRGTFKTKTTGPKGLEFLLAYGCDACASGNVDSLGRGLNSLARVLVHHAEAGSEDASIELAWLALETTNAIKKISLKKPSRFRDIARNLEEWPSMISNHPDWRRENATIRKKIRLGSAISHPQRKRVTRFPTLERPNRHVIHSYCYRLVELVEIVRAYYGRVSSRFMLEGRGDLDDLQIDPPAFQEAGKICDLTKKSAQTWFNVAWDLLMFLTESHPEKLPGLTEIGKYRRLHTLPAIGEPSLRIQATNIRDGVRHELQRAFLIRFGPPRTAKLKRKAKKGNTGAKRARP